MNTRRHSKPRAIRAVFVLSMVVSGLVFGGCCHSRHRLSIGDDKASVLERLAVYQNTDLRLLEKDIRETIAQEIDRVRGVEFWPAFLSTLQDAGGHSYNVYVESPGIPEANPPTGIIRITVFEQGQSCTPFWLRTFNSSGSLQHATIVRDHQLQGLGDLLEFVVRYRNSVVREIYTLSNNGGTIYPALIRVEDKTRHVLRTLRSTYFGVSVRNVAQGYRADSSWPDLMKPERLPDLLAALLDIASPVYPDEQKEYATRTELIRYLQSSGILRALAEHDNEWVREYATLIGACHD